MLPVSEKEQAFSAIREAIVVAAKQFLSTFKQDWAGEEMFGFLLVAVWEGYSVEAVAGTEEGLLRVVNELGILEGKDDEESIRTECLKYRWSGYEDAWYENFDGNFFSQANQLISESHESGLMETGDQQLQQICIEVLRELDSAEVFGVGAVREKITIGVSDVGGDHADEDFLSWAEPVNPPIVMERLRRDLKESDELIKAELALRRKVREAAKPNNPDGAGTQE
jgi:Domain of unknown function (DUF4303)